MHEASLAQSLIEIIRQEMDKHGLTKLNAVTVRHGKLAGIMPEAFAMAFTTITLDTPLADAVLTMEEVKVKVKCFGCGKEFTPGADSNTLYMPCPHCGEEFGHEVLEGKELYLDRLEAE